MAEKEKVTGQERSNVHEGAEVDIVQKHHQRTDILTHGYVYRLLTKSKFHPHGIKVELETGEIGRVKWVYLEE